ASAQTPPPAQTPAPASTAAPGSLQTTISPSQQPVSAHDIVGTWQGALHIVQANRDLRIVNKITRDDKGQLRVLDYSIDQGGQAMAATSASFVDGLFKYGIDPIGGKYEGRMSPDGKTITG